MFSRSLTMSTRTLARSFGTSPAARADKPLGESIKETVQDVANKFKNTGSVGSKFEKGGDVAEAAEEVGGPFSAKGAVGKQFVRTLSLVVIILGHWTHSMHRAPRRVVLSAKLASRRPRRRTARRRARDERLRC
jgi:hypothetical protein